MIRWPSAHPESALSTDTRFDASMSVSKNLYFNGVKLSGYWRWCVSLYEFIRFFIANGNSIRPHMIVVECWWAVFLQVASSTRVPVNSTAAASVPVTVSSASLPSSTSSSQSSLSQATQASVSVPSVSSPIHDDGTNSSVALISFVLFLVAVALVMKIVYSRRKKAQWINGTARWRMGNSQLSGGKENGSRVAFHGEWSLRTKSFARHSILLCQCCLSAYFNFIKSWIFQLDF